jgi:Rieske Fe-S protein
VPVEVRLTAEGWVARSLRCTHFGCTVQWSEDQGRYECPCHAGAFDAGGRPIAGPPVAPLPSFPVRREGGVLVVTVT